VTFSIVGRSEDGRALGVAVASRFIAVGAVVPAATVGIGAAATQADANPRWKRQALELLRDGLSAPDAVAHLVAQDPRPQDRQLGVVDAQGRSASHTGADCLDWAGSRTAANVALQGNVLTGPEVLEEMERAWIESAGRELPERLFAALLAGDRAGGDRRGRQSAALFVVEPDAGYAGSDDVAVDLRVDDHTDPLGELRRLLDLNEFYLTAPPDEDRVPVTSELDAELERRAREFGHDDFKAWVGTENWEMRVATDHSWIDRRVLEIVRSR
jgi:uncharacterized Ntn-hydrolase superfamily protein